MEGKTSLADAAAVAKPIEVSWQGLGCFGFPHHFLRLSLRVWRGIVVHVGDIAVVTERFGLALPTKATEVSYLLVPGDASRGDVHETVADGEMHAATKCFGEALPTRKRAEALQLPAVVEMSGEAGELPSVQRAETPAKPRQH